MMPLSIKKKKDNLIYSFSDNNWFFQLPSLLIMVFELIFIFRSPQFKFNFWQDIALKLVIFKTNLIQSVQGTQKRVFRAIRRNKNTTVGSSRGSPSLLKDDSQGLGQRITFGLGGHSMGPHLVVTVPYRAYSVLLGLVLFRSLTGNVYRCV